jgi:hypothetical protein
VLVALFVVRAPAALDGRTTEHEEYGFTSAFFATMPRGCRVAYVAFAGRRNVFMPVYAAPEPLTPEEHLRMDGRGPIEVHMVVPDGGCTFYVRDSLCTSVEGRPLCDQVERELMLEPVARASFPAVPSYDELPYDRPMVETVISRVVGFRGPPP